MTEIDTQPDSVRESATAAELGADSAAAPSHDAIARQAYCIYVNSGRKQGRCGLNWHQAEQELCQKSPTAGSPELGETRRGRHEPDHAPKSVFADALPTGADRSPPMPRPAVASAAVGKV